jgi:hypothetical protein
MSNIAMVWILITAVTSSSGHIVMEAQSKPYPTVAACTNAAQQQQSDYLSGGHYDERAFRYRCIQVTRDVAGKL